MSNDSKSAAAQEAVARQTMATCPRDGTVVLLHWGEDHVSPGWWDAPCAPVKNGDGTWPSDTGGFPWAFFDLRDGTAFVNHAVDTEYGPTHWSAYAAPVAAAPVDSNFGFHWSPEQFAAPIERIAGGALADYEGVAADESFLRNAATLIRRMARTPAAPGIDLRPYRAAIEQAISNVSYMTGEGSAFVKLTELRDMIDASPKGVNTAPRFELTSGQIAQLHDFAGTPVTGPPLEDQEVLVIQHADAGHSGPGLYAHYDELPEEGAIYLDGQSPDSHKDGSDATAFYDASAKGFHISETCGPDGKYHAVSKFQTLADLHAFEDARRTLLIAERDRRELHATSHGAGVSE